MPISNLESLINQTGEIKSQFKKEHIIKARFNGQSGGIDFNVIYNNPEFIKWKSAIEYELDRLPNSRLINEIRTLLKMNGWNDESKFIQLEAKLQILKEHLPEIIPDSRGSMQTYSSNEERLNAQLLAAGDFLADLIAVCDVLCNNRTYDQTSQENSMNDYIRDMLRARGYTEVRDQTRHGVSASGNNVGSVDILVTKNGKESTLIEGLNLKNVDKGYIDKHIQKSILNYNALGTATFILAYVSAVEFQGFWERYCDYLRGYEYPKPVEIRRDFNIQTHPNAAIRVADIVISKDDYDFPVYFLAVNVRK